MPEVRFTHPDINEPLSIETGANSIQWGYGLNTQTMPTYGGEVVQVLSAYVDDLTVGGDCNNYNQMENIYKWFLTYMQLASQGPDPNHPSFVEEPVVFRYPHRQWQLKIKPHTLPSFRLGTEVVAPAWQLQAAVIESDDDMAGLSLEHFERNGFTFKQLHGGIGYDDENPFTNFYASADQYDPEEYTGKITDFYQTLIPSYLEGDFDAVLDLGSEPTRKDKKDDKDEKVEKVEPIEQILGGW